MTKYLITGGNQGLGYATVELLLKSPGNQIYLGSRDLPKGQAAVEKLSSNPKNDSSSSVQLVQINVTDDESIETAAKLGELQSLDCLINNAGIIGDTAGNGISVRDAMKSTYETNVFGVASVIDAFLPALSKSTQKASIINVSSTLGSIAERVNPENPFKSVHALGYNTSKAALNALTGFYAVLKPEIRVVSVCPGYCATNLNENRGTNPPESGAEAIVKAAVDVNGESGVFVNKDGKVAW